jgi:hypothetical protein
VRSALAAVKGVTHAFVTLEGHEARVEYDPTESSIPDLLAAVERASDPALAMAFKATVKR